MKNTKTRNTVLLAICLIISTFKLIAQDNSMSKTMILPSPKGVYIRIFGEATLEKIKLGESEFVVKRKRLDEATFKTVATMKMAKTDAEIAKLISEKDLQEFEKMMGKSLSESLKTSPDYKSLSIFGESNLGFLQSFGLAAFDNSVEKGNFYIYRVFQKTNSGQEVLFDETGTYFDQKNHALDSLSTELTKIVGLDSLVSFSWNIKDKSIELVPVTQKTNLFNNIDQETLKADKGTYTKIKNFFNNEGAAYSQFALNEINHSFKVFYRTNNATDWTFHSEHIAGIDSLNNRFISAEIKCNPEDLVETMVIPEDIAGNKGIQSEIARGVAVTNNSVVLIYGLNSKDSTNSIILDWAQLPTKPYYSGIELLRSSADQEMTRLAILPTNANKYIDHDVYPAGTLFTYYVRPLFIDKQDLRQEIPASTAQSCSKFSKPLPPFNLKIETVGRFPKLTWEAINEKSIFSYYVYRGTSPTSYDLISNSVRIKEFVDSSDYLSPRLTYYYKISAQNLTQDTSDFCTYVSYSPTIPIKDMYTPDLIEAEVINGEAWLKWAEVKLNDDFVEGYVLQRKAKNEKSFRTIHSGILNTARFVDTTFQKGIEYLYRVASVSIRKDTAAFSKEITLSVMKDETKVSPISNIKTTNLSESIRINWPAIEAENIAGYLIYRKQPTDTDFKIIGQVRKGFFEFEDKDVEKYETYIYTVTAIDMNGKESDIIQKKSIYREN